MDLQERPFQQEIQQARIAFAKFHEAGFDNLGGLL
jgi:hypothetical protein